jgi:hypothetical protein
MRKLLILAAAVLLASCGGNLREKLTLVGPVNVKAESLSKVVAVCTVENSSCHKVRVLDGRFTLHTGRGAIATVILGEQLTVPRRAVTELAIPLRIRFNDPLAALGLPSGAMVSGEATVRMGPVRKKIRVENESLSEFIDKLAL